VQAAARLAAVGKMTPVTFDIVTWQGSVDDRIQRSVARRSRELAELY
jgi:hypothetical protein